MRETREILLGLHEAPGIGWVTISRLKEAFGDFAKLAHADAAALRQAGMTARQADRILAACDQALAGGKLAEYRERGVDILTAADEDYPLWLSALQHRPPWVLYLKGDRRLLGNPMIAVVGTRVPTAYGKRVAREMAAALSAIGITVVSGLARGIDGEAHAAALDGAGRTAAVLGTPIDEVYPREHAGLMAAIARDGLAISEYPPGTPKTPGLFPLRNRIIAGLCAGVVVVEADIGSGSLITADLALKNGREVYAVPGPISSPKSRGTLRLIKDGAGVVTGAAETAAEIAANVALQCPAARIGGGFAEAPGEQLSDDGLSEDERKVLSFLHDRPVDADRLMALTAFDFGHLHTVLLSLLMKNRIEQRPGPSYILVY